MVDPEPGPSHSLAICTYNRADSLRRTLRSVEQALVHCAPGEWEVLVIDNNSSDHTTEICREFATGLPLRYVFEPAQGLSHARNRAMVECQGDLLLFTDDDVVVDEHWLAEYAKNAALFQGADFFGGRMIPGWSTSRPQWLNDETMPLFAGLLGNYDLGESSRWICDGDPLPFGANFAITRRLFHEMGRFRTDLGVKGNIPGRGEEADYLRRARQAGYKGAYIATAICHHFVQSDRFSLSYLYRYGVEKGIAETRMQKSAAKGRAASELMYGLRGLVQLTKGRGDRFRQCVINMGIQRGLRQNKYELESTH